MLYVSIDTWQIYILSRTPVAFFIFSKNHYSPWPPWSPSYLMSFVWLVPIYLFICGHVSRSKREHCLWEERWWSWGRGPLLGAIWWAPLHSACCVYSCCREGWSAGAGLEIALRICADGGRIFFFFFFFFTHWLVSGVSNRTLYKCQNL